MLPLLAGLASYGDARKEQQPRELLLDFCSNFVQFLWATADVLSSGHHSRSVMIVVATFCVVVDVLRFVSGSPLVL